MKELFMIIKYWLMKPIDKFKIDHTICCPKCYKEWHQFRKYQHGQNTLCKNCRKQE